jgi:hypothetical protein
MNWTDFSFLYLLANLATLALVGRYGSGEWKAPLRALIFASLILLVFDALAEQRRFWWFPNLCGLQVFEVPVENIAITVGTVANSLTLYLLFDGRLRRHN